jgi:hypothetical protein
MEKDIISAASTDARCHHFTFEHMLGIGIGAHAAGNGITASGIQVRFV